MIVVCLIRWLWCDRYYCFGGIDKIFVMGYIRLLCLG